MLKHLIVFLISLTVYLLSACLSLVNGNQPLVAGCSAMPQSRVVEKKQDPRVVKLKSFLDKNKSPLSQYAHRFIQAADDYHLETHDLTYLLPAITGLESSFGKHYLVGTYNAYGWGGGRWRFSSWEESINFVTRALKEKYIDRGAISVARIGPIYAESPTWASRVTAIIGQIESYQGAPQISTLTL